MNSVNILFEIWNFSISTKNTAFVVVARIEQFMLSLPKERSRLLTLRERRVAIFHVKITQQNNA